MKPDFPYTKLPAAYRGFVRKASLWEGTDHILSISGTRFQEEYRRFYFADIQALIIERRARASSLGLWLLLLLCFVGLLITALVLKSTSWGLAALIAGVLLASWLDLALRRSCRCFIQTAVSRELLPAVLRIKVARELSLRLRSRIATFQGDTTIHRTSAHFECGTSTWTTLSE